ncbi:hypothetical protein WMY93_002924 [Mugilogobius chulae]|uniref:Myb/SANT-like DNA-binding domain-containing protein n=1 Tax=Mugilogobius chulae TaxID=88201 RepID=A0AAW0PWS6_9GOBI
MGKMKPHEPAKHLKQMIRSSESLFESRLYSASGGTDEDVRRLILLRTEKNSLFSGKRFALASGWEAVLREMGLTGVVSPARAAKKWENLKKTYKELRRPPTGSGTETGETTAATWKWYSLMDEAIGSRPSVQPPCLIASSRGEGPSTSAASSQVSVPQEQEDEEDEEQDEGRTGRRKRARRDSLVELLKQAEKREEERERKEEERGRKRY